MGKIIVRIVFFVCVAFPIQQLFAQSGVGIGTSNPNPNAALDIQSAANDKGILIPRLTSAERLAMNGSLSANENGLLVFDSDLKTFYFWSGSIWTSMSVIQDLQLIGNILSITNNGAATNIDLSPFSGTNTDNQNLSSSSSGNNRTINISGGAPTTFNIADNDNNSSNELQTISKAGSTVTLSDGGGAISINDGDSSPTNEIQNLGIVGNDLSITGGNTVTLPTSTKEAFKAYLDKTVVINNIITAVIFDIKEYDLNNNYDNGTGAYTAPLRGIYHFNGLLSLNTGSLPTRIIISAGGVAVYDKQVYPGDSNESFDFAADIFLDKGDVVGIIIFVTDANSFTINGTRAFTFVSGRLVTEL